MIILSLAMAVAKIGQTLNQTKIVGYYEPRSNGVALKDIDVTKITHLLYAFATVYKDGTTTFSAPGTMDWNAWATTQVVDAGDNNCACGNTCLKGYLNQLWEVKRNNPSLRTVLSIGGWAWSSNFSAVFKDQGARANMIKTATNMMTTYGFDGIDIDWEFPTSARADEPTYTFDPNDFANLAVFLQEIRAYWKSQNLPDDMILSVAAPPQLQLLTAGKTILKQLNTYTSFVMVMSYEFQHNEEFNRLGAPLYGAPDDSSDEKSKNIATGISDYAGIDKSKLVMGIPLYATGFTNFNPNTGNRSVMKCLGDTFNNGGKVLDPVDYKTILTNVTGNSLNYGGYQYDPVRGTSSACNGTHFYSFDTVESVAQKTKYVKDQGLGGVMLWDLSQDFSEKDSASKSIYVAVKTSMNAQPVSDRQFTDICLQNSQYCNLKCDYTPDKATANIKKATAGSPAQMNTVATGSLVFVISILMQ